MTPVQIFMLGWYEYAKRIQTLFILGEYNPVALAPPTEAEIKQILADQESHSAPPYDQAQMKEYPIG